MKLPLLLGALALALAAQITAARTRSHVLEDMLAYNKDPSTGMFVTPFIVIGISNVYDSSHWTRPYWLRRASSYSATPLNCGLARLDTYFEHIMSNY